MEEAELMADVKAKLLEDDVGKQLCTEVCFSCYNNLVQSRQIHAAIQYIWATLARCVAGVEGLDVETKVIEDDVGKKLCTEVQPHSYG